ncbi:Ras guanine nucleotide exchange factor K-like [Oopsacas minuta]|uniref:Ras guanine nucleotide exchange factor K-like n=1 Tax=Oopsacas minuta TaxID=111878 RepID=A0AAV7JZ24_9METZ|nr:Ras guanine nucleotide exchange factor K-like [Oopsacas minuta]
MLCDYCLMTVSTPAFYASGEKGKGKEITFRFSPLAKIGLLRGAILREFLERTHSSPALLSTLHLCYFNDRDRTWIWLDESLPLFTYNLQRECRIELKPSTPHSTGVRIVLPDIERTMMVTYDQFTIVSDLLSQVLQTQKLRIKDTKGFSLFHVRLRITLDPNRSLTYYETLSQDTLECRVAPGKMECRSISIYSPQTDTYHHVDVCLDQTIGDLISLLIRQLPNYDYSHWHHSALYYKPKDGSKGQWLDDYKYLYYYSIDPDESLEFKARYRPLVFDLHIYFSNRDQRERSLTLLLSQNILVQQVLELLHATCSFEFETEFYGLYQHNGQQIPNEVRLCEYLDNIANRKYEDTVRVQMIPMPVEVELVEEGRRDQEQCSIVTYVDFSRPSRDLRNLLTRRFGVRNKHTCIITFEDIELDLKMSLFDNGVTEKSTVYFVHKTEERLLSPSPVLDYSYNSLACTITPDLLADLPRKMEVMRSKSLMLPSDMPNIWDDQHEDQYNIRYVQATKNVSAATFNKLVIRLTSDQDLDLGFVKTFLLTYRAYTSPKILLQKLEERYNVIRSRDKSINDFNISRTKIQLRVINALKFWLELGFDFEDDSSLQRQMMDFIDNVLYDDQPKMCRRLRTLLLILQGKLDKSDKQNTREKPPPIKVNKSALTASCLTELDPEEVARQLTLIDFAIYSKIKPYELLNQAWAKPKYKHKAKNVHCLIERLNNLTLWVATVILSYTEDYQRAKAISAFVKIAYHLYRLHNFSTLMAIYCGVQHGSITRLYRTWSKVDRSTNKLLEDLTTVCDPQLGHSNMREEMTNANPPCLPYIIIYKYLFEFLSLSFMQHLFYRGLYMKDLTLIDEGNPNLMQDGLINFLKCDMIYKSIRDVQMYQQKNYNYEEERSINASLSSFQFVDEKTAYQRSELYEPRIRRV